MGSFGCGALSRCSFNFSGICLSLSCAINSVCISQFSLSVNERYTCLWKFTPCNFLSFPGSVHSHTWTKYVGLRFLHLHRDIMHTHTHTPIIKHVKTLVHAQLGDVKHQAEVSQGCHFPGVFFYFVCLFWVFWGWAGGMSEASSGSGSPQSSTGPSNWRSWRNHVVTSVCASRQKDSSKGTHVWFLWFDKFTFAKKKKDKRQKKKIGPAWGREGGVLFRTRPWNKQGTFS